MPEEVEAPVTAVQRIQRLRAGIRNTQLFSRAKADSIVRNIVSNGGDVGPALQTELDGLYGECGPEPEPQPDVPHAPSPTPSPEAAAPEAEAAPADAQAAA